MLLLIIVFAQIYLVKNFNYDAFNIAFIIVVVFTACYYNRPYAVGILFATGVIDCYIFQAPRWSFEINLIDAFEVFIYMGIGAAIIFIISSFKKRQLKSAIEQNRFELALRGGSDGVLMSDGKGKFLFASESIKDILGFTSEEYLKINPYELIHPEDSPNILSSVQAFKSEHHATLAFCYRHKHRNGSWVWIEGNLSNFLQEPTINVILCNFRDVTQRKLLEEQKNDFINFAAHEFKSPLSIIKGYTQILLNKAKQEDKGVKELTTIEHQTSHLILIVKNYLDLASIEKSLQLPVMKEFCLDQLAESVLGTFLIPDSFEIFSNIDEGLKVKGDQERIRQVMVNYLSNAVKYSSGTNRIEVSVSVHNSNVRFAVRDFGLGISELNQTRIFKRYSRVNISPTVEGSGIGLYLCAQIIAQHKGTIGCNSQIGEGSEFWFELEKIDDSLNYLDNGSITEMEKKKPLSFEL